GRYERAAFGATFSDDEGTTYGTALDSTPLTPDAERWQGWGTALKPSFEPVVCARKPLTGTVAANVLERGTGALNIDGCRVATSESLSRPSGYNTFLLGGYSTPAELEAAATTDEVTPDGKNRARAVLARFHQWSG